MIDLAPPLRFPAGSVVIRCEWPNLALPAVAVTVVTGTPVVEVGGGFEYPDTTSTATDAAVLALRPSHLVHR